MMLPKLFNVVIFMMVLLFGALANPVAKPQGDIAEPAIKRSDLTERFSGTPWTWYDVQTGNEVFCGGRRSNDEAIVALSGSNMNQGECGKRIKLTYGSITKYATIVDKCPGCQPQGLDLSKGLFSQFVSLDTGVIKGDWVYA